LGGKADLGQMTRGSSFSPQSRNEDYCKRRCKWTNRKYPDICYGAIVCIIVGGQVCFNAIVSVGFMSIPAQL
jgi:hypothetical protein